MLESDVIGRAGALAAIIVSGTFGSSCGIAAIASAKPTPAISPARRQYLGVVDRAGRARGGWPTDQPGDSEASCHGRARVCWRIPQDSARQRCATGDHSRSVRPACPPVQSFTVGGRRMHATAGRRLVDCLCRARNSRCPFACCPDICVQSFCTLGLAPLGRDGG